jgi:hypothetical protein
MMANRKLVLLFEAEPVDEQTALRGHVFGGIRTMIAVEQLRRGFERTRLVVQPRVEVDRRRIVQFTLAKGETAGDRIENIRIDARQVGEAPEERLEGSARPPPKRVETPHVVREYVTDAPRVSMNPGMSNTPSVLRTRRGPVGRRLAAEELAIFDGASVEKTTGSPRSP